MRRTQGADTPLRVQAKACGSEVMALHFFICAEVPAVLISGTGPGAWPGAELC